MRGSSTKRAQEAGANTHHVGEVVRYYRTRTDPIISARALSLACGLSESYVGKMESASIEPSLKAFACIMQQLNLSPAEIGVLVLQEARRAMAMPELSHPLSIVDEI